MIPFEYYAMKFTNQWELEEKQLHIGLTTESIETSFISKSMAYFLVARSFRGLSENGNRKFIAEKLVDFSTGLDSNNYCDRVDELTNAFYDKFGTRNVSAASKLLWLRNRSPVIIYDRWTRKALESNGLEKNANYGQFCIAWRSEFSKYEARIRDACNEVVKHKKFCAL